MTTTTANILDRLPPHSTEAEAALLGSILLDSRVLDDVSEIVGGADFYHLSHATIYAAFERIHREGKRADMVLLNETLRDRGELEDVGGLEYLLELGESVPNHLSAEHYAGIVREKALQRRLIDFGVRVAHLAHLGDGTAQEQLEAAQKAIFEMSVLRDRRGDAKSIGELADAAYQQLERRAESGELEGIQTGFVELDAMLGGLRGGEVIIVAGRPSMGKSAIAFAVAQNLALAGTPVGCFSLEMSDKSLANRLLSSVSGVRKELIRYPDQAKAEDWEAWASAVGKLRDAPLYIQDCPGLTLAALHAKARKMVARLGVKCLLIDYLQIMGRDSRKSENEGLGELSNGIQRMARELDVPVILLSQLNRSVEHREDKRPTMADLRGSGSIEQDADVVLLLYRHDYYERQKNPHHQPDHGALVVVGKQRDGATGGVALHFDAQRGRFADWPNMPKPDWM